MCKHRERRKHIDTSFKAYFEAPAQHTKESISKQEAPVYLVNGH